MPITVPARFDAPLDATSVAVSKGRAVCLATSLQAYTLATSANRAALATTGPTITGLALTDGNAGQGISILCMGIADASIVGTLSGSGNWVNVQSDGSLARASAVSSDTIGSVAPDGSVIIDITLQQSGAVTGNATAIQGVSVSSSPAAAKDDALIHDGTQWKPLNQIRNVMNYGAKCDAVTDDSAAFQACFNACNPGDMVFVPAPPTSSTYYLIKTPRVRLEATQRNVTVCGEMDSRLGGISNYIICDYHEPNGSAGGYWASNALSSGSGGQQMMYIDITTQAANSPLTTSNYADYLGYPLEIYNTADDRNKVEGPIAAIFLDGSNHIIACVFNANAVNVDANSGSWMWRICQPAFQMLGSGQAMKNLSIMPKQTGGVTRKYSMLLEINQSDRTDAVAVGSPHLENVTLWGGHPATGPWARYGLSIARSTAPRAGAYGYTGVSGYYSLNGAPDTISQQYNPPNVSEIHIDRCSFWYFWEAGIELVSQSGQSYANLCEHSMFIGCAVACLQPFRAYAVSGLGGQTGQGAMSFKHCEFSSCRDYALRLPATAGDNIVIEDILTEGGSGMVSIPGAGTAQNITIKRWKHSCKDVTLKTGYLDCFVPPTGDIISIGANRGPIHFEDLYINPTTDVCNYHIELGASNIHIHAKRITFYGQTTRNTLTGRVAELFARKRGPYKFAGTEQLIIAVNGVSRTVNFAQSDFNAAIENWTVDLNRVSSLEIGRVITNQLRTLGAVAHGAADSSRLKVATTAGTGAATLRPTTSPTQLDFDTTTTQTGSSPLDPICTDYLGYFDMSRVAGSFSGTLDVDDCVAYNASNTKLQLVSTPHRRVGTPTNDAGVVGVFRGIANHGAALTKNLSGSLDISDANTTGTVTFSTQEADAAFKVTSLAVTDKTGTPATKSAKVTQGSKTQNGFGITLDAAPGVGNTVTVEWMITR